MMEWTSTRGQSCDGPHGETETIGPGFLLQNLTRVRCRACGDVGVKCGDALVQWPPRRAPVSLAEAASWGWWDPRADAEGCHG